MNMNMMQLSKFVKWSVFGDGCVSNATHNSNAHYCIQRDPIHEDYIQLIASKFVGLQDCTVSISRYQRKDNQKNVVALRTTSHPLFTRIRNRQYINGHRVVCPHMLTLLDWEAAAYLYMDEGSLCFNNKGTPIVRLSTCAYSYHEQMAVRLAFAEKLGVLWNVNKARKGFYQLNLAKKSFDTWFAGVQEYMVPSYRYKLPTCLQEGTPRTGDDLVYLGQAEATLAA